MGLIAAAGDWAWSVLGLLAIPALVALNGLFVAAEFSLVAVRRTRVEELVNRGVRGARAIDQAVRRLDRSLAATQLGITLSSIGIGWAGEPALARVLQPLFDSLPGIWVGVTTHTVASVIAFILIMFMHSVFGELVPRALALRQPDTTALLFAPPLVIFAKLTRPITLLMSGSANAIVRLLGFQPPHGEQMVHSVEELLLLIEDTEEAGILEPDQADIVENIFQISSKEVRDCMIPADKMAALELSTPPDKVLEAVRSGAHTRMPVYEGNVDNIVGIVNTKNLFHLFSLQGVVILHDALYPAVFLKPDNTVSEALRLFRKSHRPMALVRTDEGKILGLITLEDVLEEIVGDIEDEHDIPVPRKVLRKRPAIKSSSQAKNK